MKCAEYKELAEKRVGIWKNANEKLEQLLEEWGERDKELYESIDIDDLGLPEPPILDSDSLGDDEVVREELATAKRVGETLIKDVQEFLRELKLRTEAFDKTIKEINTILAEVVAVDTPVYAQIARALDGDNIESDDLPDWEEFAGGSYQSVGDFVIELRQWATSFADDCEDE